MYKQIDETTIQRLSDGAFIPADDRNPSYQEFTAWIAAGNTIEAADPIVQPDPAPADVSSTLIALLIDKGVIAADDLHPDVLAVVNDDLTAAGQDAIVATGVKNEVA